MDTYQKRSRKALEDAGDSGRAKSPRSIVGGGDRDAEEQAGVSTGSTLSLGCWALGEGSAASAVGEGVALAVRGDGQPPRAGRSRAGSDRLGSSVLLDALPASMRDKAQRWAWALHEAREKGLKY